MPKVLYATPVVKTPTAAVTGVQGRIAAAATPPHTPSTSATVMWQQGKVDGGGAGGIQVVHKREPPSPAAASDFVPVTPTSSLASRTPNNIVVTPSSSGGSRRGTAAAFAIVKQEGSNRLKAANVAGAAGKLVTAVPVSASSDHEYGQYSTPQHHKRTIYLTPSSSSGGVGGSAIGAGPRSIGPTSVVMASGAGVPHVKSEARRKLNLDAAAPIVDPEGFKTPIKSAAKRKAHDLSSPSPKKSKCIDDDFFYMNGY